MIHWSQLQPLLADQNIQTSVQQLVRDFLNSHPFQQRQQLMAILMHFPNKIALFTELLKKKTELAADPQNQKLQTEIATLETKEAEEIINQK